MTSRLKRQILRMTYTLVTSATWGNGRHVVVVIVVVDDVVVVVVVVGVVVFVGVWVLHMPLKYVIGNGHHGGVKHVDQQCRDYPTKSHRSGPEDNKR